MAEYVWTGAADDGNWNTAGNWTPSGPPGSLDGVVFDTGTKSVTIAPSSDLLYAHFKVLPDYMGSLGTSGAPIRGGANLLRLEGQCEQIWLHGAGFGYAAAFVDAMASDNACHFAGDGVPAGGIMTVVSGRVTLDATYAGAGLHVVAPSGRNPFVPVLILSAGAELSGTAIGLSIVDGVASLSGEIAGTAVVAGGEVHQSVGSSVAVLHQTGGACHFDAGTLTTGHLLGGLLDMSRGIGPRVCSAVALHGTGPTLDLRNGIGFEPTTVQVFGRGRVWRDPE